jgi:NTP pyrophosphatase (non-canonical NTP hydrolase)
MNSCMPVRMKAHEQELKELADLVYVCFQYAENMEWDLEEAMFRVHKSNMSKLGLDNKPIRREGRQGSERT